MSHESSGILLSQLDIPLEWETLSFPSLFLFFQNAPTEFTENSHFPLPDTVNGFSVADLTGGAFVIGRQDLE